MNVTRVISFVVVITTTSALFYLFFFLFFFFFRLFALCAFPLYLPNGLLLSFITFFFFCLTHVPFLPSFFLEER